jgi:hypothetical protein
MLEIRRRDSVALLDNAEACRSARAQQPSLPVIAVLTGAHYYL